MRFTTSKNLLAGLENLKIGEAASITAVPRTKKDGTLDMRFRANRELVAENAMSAQRVTQEQARAKYWLERQKDQEFWLEVQQQMNTPVYYPVSKNFFSPTEIQSIQTEIRQLEIDPEAAHSLPLFKDTPQIEYSALRFDDKNNILGRGAFGVVKKAYWVKAGMNEVGAIY